MNSQAGRGCKRAALTLIELLAVLAIVMIVAALLLPAVQRSIVKARQTQCLGNLRQVGIAFNSFAHDHGGRFPMQIPIRSGGSMEANRQTLAGFPTLSFSPWHFRVMSNQLASTRVVVCPADKRSAAKSFPAMQASNISYWVNPRAVPGNSVQFLSGDRNLVTIGVRTNQTRASAPDARFTRELHASRGNVLFADGHAELLGVASSGSLGGGGGEQGPISPPAPGNPTRPTGTGESTPAPSGASRQPVPNEMSNGKDSEEMDSSGEAKNGPSANAETPEENPSREPAGERNGGKARTGSKSTMTPIPTPARSPVGGESAGDSAAAPGFNGHIAGPGGTNQPAPNPEGGRRRFIDLGLLKAFAIGLYLLGLILLILYLAHRYLNRRKRGKKP